VAYEVAQLLKAQGEKVIGITMWDSFPPGTWRLRKFRWRIRAIHGRIRKKATIENASYLKALVTYFRERLILRSEHQKELSQKASKSPFEIRELEVRAANRVAQRSYQPKPYDGAVMTVIATPDETLFESVPGKGWRNILVAPWENFHIDCDHRELILEPFVGNLAERVSAFLKRSESTANLPSQSVSIK
jgi:thioesterase domain-containing protein